MKRTILLATIFLAALGTASALTVVPSVVTFQSQAPYFATYPGSYSIMLYQDAAQTDYTGVWFNYDITSRRLSLGAATIDESSDWYFVAAGETFAWAGIAAGEHVSLTNPVFISPPALNQSYSDFYIGGTTGRGFQNNGRPNRTVLAWVNLRASASGLALLGSAAAYDAGSIVVGTLNATAIPEPSSATTLAGLGATGFFLNRRRSRR